MTIDTFDDLFNASVAKMEEYINTRTTGETRAEAKHDLHMMQTNKNYLKHQFDKNPEILVTCKICGQLAAANYTEPSKSDMLNNQLCFGHALWNRRAAEHHVSSGNVMVINGHMYSDGGESRDQSQYLGHSGRRFCILRRSGEGYTTNNLWFGGCIPEEFRDRMPDDAEFITKEQYEELSK